MSSLFAQSILQPFVRAHDAWGPLRRRVVRRSARIYRRNFLRADSIGITGSFGKTTTTRLVSAVLRTRGSVSTTGQDAFISPYTIAKRLLTTPPWTRFCSFEMCGSLPGQIAKISEVLRPRIGVVTHVSYDHYSEFHDVEKIADGKADLIRALPPDGCAVLNQDDARVAAMADLCRGRVVTVGESRDATWRAENVTSRWPDALSFDLVHDGERRSVVTRLHGRYWLYPVLTAVAVGDVMGVPLDEAIRAVSQEGSIRSRMCPTTTESGVTIMDDTWKAPYHSISAALEWLREARAPRKIAVFGTISDYPGATSPKYRAIARQAMEAADTVLFVGKQSSLPRKAVPADDPARLQMFETAHAASGFLRDYVQGGDLVFVKGSGTADHLERIGLDLASGVTCWRESCYVVTHCLECRRRHDCVVPDATTA